MGLTIELRPEVKSRLCAEAARRGKAEEEVAAEIIDHALPTSSGEGNNRVNEDTAAYLLRLAEEFAVSIPEEELKAVPTDLAKNLDHYLYGHAKQE